MNITDVLPVPMCCAVLCWRLLYSLARFACEFFLFFWHLDNLLAYFLRPVVSFFLLGEKKKKKKTRRISCAPPFLVMVVYMCVWTRPAQMASSSKILFLCRTASPPSLRLFCFFLSVPNFGVLPVSTSSTIQSATQSPPFPLLHVYYICNGFTRFSLMYHDDQGRRRMKKKEKKRL